MLTHKTRSIIGIFGNPVFPGWHCGVLLCGAMLWSAGFAAAGTLYVSPVGTNDSAQKYNTWSGAATSPNAAVNAAVNGDTVYITNATYSLTNTVNVTNGVTVQGYGGQATVSGSGVRRCFYINHTNAVLDTLAIVQGWVGGYGGGVYIENGGTIQNCLVFSNYANGSGPGGRGGGIYIATTGNVFSCLIVSNSVNYASDTSSGGGGLWLAGSGIIRYCTNAYNSAGTIYNGGGMYNDAELALITNCDFTCNVATGWGGGALGRGCRVGHGTPREARCC